MKPETYKHLQQLFRDDVAAVLDDQVGAFGTMRGTLDVVTLQEWYRTAHTAGLEIGINLDNLIDELGTPLQRTEFKGYLKQRVLTDETFDVWLNGLPSSASGAGLIWSIHGDFTREEIRAYIDRLRERAKKD